jgi:hypothetical protein
MILWDADILEKGKRYFIREMPDLGHILDFTKNGPLPFSRQFPREILNYCDLRVKIVVARFRVIEI